MKSFYEFVAAKSEIPDATKVWQLVQQSGATGISHRELHRSVSLEPDTLDALLAGLVAVGQVTVSDVGGKRIYRTL